MTIKQLFRQFQQEKFDEKNVPVVFVDAKGKQHGIGAVEMDNGKVRLMETAAEDACEKPE